MAPIGCALIDLTGVPELSTPAAALRHLAALRDRLGPEPPLHVFWRGAPLGAPPPRVWLSRVSGARALAGASARVAASGGHLLVLLGAVLPGAAAVDALVDALALDPLVGFAQPRFAAASGDVWPLPGSADPLALLPRRVLPLLPDRYLTTERVAACLVARREAVASFAADPDGGTELPEALRSELSLARRRGFRTLVVNTVTVAAAGIASPYPRPGPPAGAAEEPPPPDVRRADDLFTRAAHQRFEAVVVHARRPRPEAALPVLLDCRGASPRHNGTSDAILGFLGGLREVAPAWELDALFRPEAVDLHRPASAYPGVRVLTALPERTYAAAVRLDQPWHLSTVAELHRRACALTFNILDTIAWDVAGAGTLDVERAWRFVAERADGLLFNSAFTQGRFQFRFPIAPDVLQTVTHHATGAPGATGRDRPGEHLLVFGNDLAHKGVAATAAVLRRAFPYERIVALGPTLDDGPNLTALSSGRLPAEEIERLVAGARVVVFPSFYEGFGLPVAQALALGRPVVVRASPLWWEIAGLSRGPGRLLEFVAAHELVEQVARAIAGEPAPEVPLGGGLPAGGAPLTWRDCARTLVDHVERTIAGFDGRRWFSREHVLELATAGTAEG
ncbi:MAG TPA: glycosyltransferase [Anaeromyxobacter sp.]|nr:glycosyltransferase [Anaeromyxobacter sp.]